MQIRNTTTRPPHGKVNRGFEFTKSDRSGDHVLDIEVVGSGADLIDITVDHEGVAGTFRLTLAEAHKVATRLASLVAYPNEMP